ncbi:MAG TPA: hypothetical protein DCY75_11230 [Clostridiales bacterium]|nr:hypothetical protein [Clostridiales bacterium]
MDFLVIKTADAIVLADKKKRPLSPKTALGTAPGLGFIRIFRMKDQTLVTNPPFGDPNLGEPYTEGDDDVLVLGFFDGDKPVGAVVNFACHPAIVAKTYTSADFIGALSANLKEIYGPRFVTLFVTGACGNINHINRFDRSTAAPGRHVYIGQQLAEVTVKLLQEAVAVDAEKVGYAVDTVRLGLRRPSEEALLEAKALIDGFGDDFMHQTGKSKQYKDVFFALQTLWRMADKNSFVDAEVQVFDFGGITLFGMPAQMFCEYGKALKEAKGKKAIVSIFANMYLGYCPVPVCMVPGVYEAKLATSSMLQSDSGDKLVKTALELCEKIHTNPVKEAEKVKK